MRKSILSFIILSLASTQLLAGQIEADLRATDKMLYIPSVDQRFSQLPQQYAASICTENNADLIEYMTELASKQPRGTKVSVPDFGNVFPMRNAISLYPLEAYVDGMFKMASHFAHSMSYNLNQSEDSIMVKIICKSRED